MYSFKIAVLLHIVISSALCQEKIVAPSITSVAHT